MKIAVFSTKPYDRDYFEKHPQASEYQLHYFETNLTDDTASLSKGFDAVCVFVNDKVHESVIKVLANNGVKLIALRCAGYNNVDVNSAKAHGLKVVRVPAYSPHAVAEHTMALILTLNRKTHKAYNRIREGNFSLNNLMGFDVFGKTIGVVGTGQIGAAFCKIVKGFGCNIIAFDLYPSEELIALGVTYGSVEDVFKTSDIISLHCPLTEDTKHIVNSSSIELMKNHVMIINTSRGALINTSDIIKGLSSKKVGFLGIDVYEQEENLFFKDLSESIIQDDDILRLMSFPNVLITSHQAYFTKEAMEEITRITYENLRAYNAGEFLKNEVK
ncbi:2-hydroxyacid dehydrogenase [Winogradskyella aurantia]|uniref:Hydroxyacid dehydrogenase n=1 Tax=Winogradskyella aurantia TaxID=1915063 RepID=A0A265UTJ9_9FLAO|nr:2-hydroxyacid dehydrogenase [Winogradskyella aurantia]OZV68645.1 hydroxyacid dehydrogenase [Winogradskyella aurantia]